MEEKKTLQYKRTLRGSVGAGLSALAGGKGRRYFVLEHRDPSKYHKAGESQKIIIDQVELGRSADCQVRFDDDTFPTVSRRHAAIVREGDRWKLVQLSATNSTLLNGRKIDTEWYLQNGDEIQLALDGPRMGFIVPEGNQGLVSSIKMAERLELFRKQALAPYKRAIAVLAVLLLVLSAGGSYKLYDLHQKNVESQKSMQALRASNDTMHSEIKKQAEIIARQDASINKGKRDNASLRVQLGSLRRELEKIKVDTQKVVKLDEYSKDVYFIGLRGYTITSPDGSKAVLEPGDSIWNDKVKFRSGTGFLMSDGRFITARHVVEPWFFGKSEIDIRLNNLSCSGYTIIGHFFAIASGGKPIEFSTDQFAVNRSTDKVANVKVSEDYALKLRLASNDYSDYAFCAPGRNGNLVADNDLSRNLKAGQKLKILGFPLGIGASSKKVTPIYATADVAKDGLTEEGYILTTATGFEQGNSGGPVFAEQDGKMVVVGIVSAGGGRSTGFVVPICVVK